VKLINSAYLKCVWLAAGAAFGVWQRDFFAGLFCLCVLEMARWCVGGIIDKDK